jgi:hypothetical protein
MGRGRRLLWTGNPEQLSVGSESRDKYLQESRSRVMGSEWSQRYNEETDELWEGRLYDIHTWPQEKTIIQWQGEEIAIDAKEEIGSVGAWQAFTETVPNIEVRIGAILSLERIAQDSTRYDKGRDHVRVMEILCAYAKENTPVGDHDTKGATQSKRTERDAWINKLPNPRQDIQIALRVIGRRSSAQRAIEETHLALDGQYRLDLSALNLRKINLTGLNFDNAFLRGSWFDGALLNHASFKNANLLETSFTAVSAANARFQRANLGADFSGAILDRATFEFIETDDDDSLLRSENGRSARFTEAQLLNASISFTGNPSRPRNWFIGARFEGAIMRGCLFEGFNHFFEHEWPDFFHHGTKHEKGLAFRNCHLTENLEKRCALELCFADGSVTLSDGSGPDSPRWPDNWPKAVLSDFEYRDALRKWRLSRP